LTPLQLYFYLVVLAALVELALLITQTVRLTIAQRVLRELSKNVDEVARARAERMASELIKQAREDAVKRSSAVVTGKVYEQLAPYMPWFKYNPREARFLGSPVDFIVFDGIEGGGPVTVRFVEVKSGDSRLSDRERAIKEAIERCSVTFEVVRPEGPAEKGPK